MFFSDNLGSQMAVKEATRTELSICEFCIWARAVEAAATMPMPPLVEKIRSRTAASLLQCLTVEEVVTVAEHFFWTLVIEFKSPVRFRLTEAMVKTGAKEPNPCFYIEIGVFFRYLDRNSQGSGAGGGGAGGSIYLRGLEINVNDGRVTAFGGRGGCGALGFGGDGGSGRIRIDFDKFTGKTEPSPANTKSYLKTFHVLCILQLSLLREVLFV